MYSQWRWAHAHCCAPIPTLVSRTLLSFSWEPLSPLNTASLSTPPSCPWWPLSYSLSLWIWLSGALSMCNHPVFILCDRLIPHSIVSSRLVPGVACVRVVPVSLRSSSIPPCVYIASCLSVRWLMGTWVASTVWLLWIMLLWTCLCRYLFESLLSLLLNIHPEVSFLYFTVILFYFWATSILFSTGLYHFIFPPAVHKGSSLFTFLITLVFCVFSLTVAILVSVKLYLIVVLICIYLKTSEVEHLFMSLLSICISSEYVLCPFWNQVVVSCCFGPERVRATPSVCHPASPNLCECSVVSNRY